MPTLEWIGKSKVINHYQEDPIRTVEHKYSFDENGQYNEDNCSENGDFKFCDIITTSDRDYQRGM